MLLMLSVSGLRVAFRAKPLVNSSVEHAISNLGLDAIRERDKLLYFFQLSLPLMRSINCNLLSYFELIAAALNQSMKGR